MSAATKTQTLAEITRAEAAAAEAAQKALAASEAARLRADAARERAERERDAANRAYLALLTAEHRDRSAAALEELGESRAALENAIASGGNVFRAYSRWAKSRTLVWECDAEINQQRYFLGAAHRETPPPELHFTNDISAILDHLSLELQDEALNRIRERKSAYLQGKTS